MQLQPVSPNGRRHQPGFVIKLAGVWLAMPIGLPIGERRANTGRVFICVDRESYSSDMYCDDDTRHQCSGPRTTNKQMKTLRKLRGRFGDQHMHDVYM